MLFETTIDPGLRRVYAAIDYAANQAMVEIAELALDAYPRIWGRRACEKPLYLRAYERQNEVRHCIDLLMSGVLRHRTPWRFTDSSQAYRFEIMELPLDGLFIARRVEGDDHDGRATVLEFFDTLRRAIDFVAQCPDLGASARELDHVLANA